MVEIIKNMSNDPLDRLLLKIFGGVDWVLEKINYIFAPKCKCKKKEDKK